MFLLHIREEEESDEEEEEESQENGESDGKKADEGTTQDYPMARLVTSIILCYHGLLAVLCKLKNDVHVHRLPGMTKIPEERCVETFIIRNYHIQFILKNCLAIVC